MKLCLTHGWYDDREHWSHVGGRSYSNLLKALTLGSWDSGSKMTVVGQNAALPRTVPDYFRVETEMSGLPVAFTTTSFWQRSH